MIYKAFQDLQLSQLGFGTMRLPLREDKSIDAEQAAAMTSEAIAKGVNYFDTAWPYHSGKSETVIGKILQNYPRESFYLADKFPGHQIAPTYDVADIFERQLKKCGVEYFDFYLLHNVYENSIGVMGRAEADDVWLTIMSNLNVSAVAKLADVACVVLCEGVVPDGALLKKAEAEKIWLLGSDKPLYGTALALATHL